MEQQTSNLFELQVDQGSRSFLTETAKWGKFLAIVGFILCAIFVLVGIFAGSLMGAAMGELGGGSAAAMGGMMTFVYILLALLYFFPCLYLYRFAVRMQVALNNNDQQSLTASFMNLKSCFKFMGILTIVILALYALIFIFGALGAVMAGV